eukprot:CAMPEP_0183338136 /NCGR_PEP_ID=MMETSP0164_2-20130417/5540_1 /TAXON_ID=221442 /ORGANISM="Coccolithus pelagicus ssp braarudi, Strain PLY182g" /LENGTH=147 /DNA_ID=CAMNT_0025507941 /DNA_START=101 /DNA_END=541 /DNA_ORIENTATION=-
MIFRRAGMQQGHPQIELSLGIDALALLTLLALLVPLGICAQLADFTTHIENVDLHWHHLLTRAVRESTNHTYRSQGFSITINARGGGQLELPVVQQGMSASFAAGESGAAADANASKNSSKASITSSASSSSAAAPALGTPSFVAAP